VVSWDPSVYGRFAAERGRPFHDLLSRLDVAAPRHVVDLGCGSGELPAVLARRWPTAQVRGIDSSPQMLERAAEQAVADDVAGRLAFDLGDLGDWTPDEPVDVLFTNAALQWVPHHLDLLPRWVRALAPGGCLALQVPGNFDAPSHTLMRELAWSEPFASRLVGVLRGTESVAMPSTYASLLAALGCSVDAWETTYVQVLDPDGEFGDDPVLAWVSGTGLRPVLDALDDDPELRQQFVDTYAERLRVAYPRRDWGTMLPFRRVFCVAHKVAA
jgi:trans-aconitate 2-methyltransferase